MTELNATQREAVQLAYEIILGTAASAGSMGAPSGPLYARLAAYGMRLASYQSLLAILEREGKIQVSGNCIHLSKD